VFKSKKLSPVEILLGGNRYFDLWVIVYMTAAREKIEIIVSSIIGHLGVS